ncbi:MAG: hypothetical protein O9262_08865, partial [Cyclobacteriaceae bacterium]|nr:hypothetical protein [Cyclobacteriaceae bacterium]
MITNKTTSITVAILIGLLIVVVSCQKNEESLKTSRYLTDKEMEGMIKLGKKLDNPYSVENMQKAWKNLQATNSNARTSDVEITTTHYYLRFKPKNEGELSLLKLDTTLIIYDYPLDYEITELGNFYHDPSIPIDQPTYKYCAVTIDKQLPLGVEYELLAFLFIPDDYKD